jgi:squalene monooxygenase
VTPRIPKLLQSSFEQALDEDRLRSMPNSFLPASIQRRHGAFLLGDAWNMRHPLTGGGMTTGLKDVCLLKLLLSPAYLPTFHDKLTLTYQLETFYWKRKSHASVINILAQALYSLFSAREDLYLLVLREACFRYFQLGGRCVTDPVGLIGGLLPTPLILYVHFFLVAFYGILLLLSGKIVLDASPPNVLIAIPMRIIDSIRVFNAACCVIVPYILTEWRS